MDDGWSMKRLTRLIVTSTTYRQSSRVTPQLLEKDAENRLLARGPRVRLDAELIRDDVLRAGGLLSAKMYGPQRIPAAAGVGHYRGALGGNDLEGEPRRRPLPPQPLHVFTAEQSVRRVRDVRRSQRRALLPAAGPFRVTPSQALTLMNSELFVELAEAAGRCAGGRQASGQDADRRFVPRCPLRGRQSLEEVARWKSSISRQLDRAPRPAS